MVKANWFDKMVAAVNPKAGVNRLVSKHEFDLIDNGMNFQAGGYMGAQQTNYRSYEAWNLSLPGDEDHILGEHDRETLRLECRNLYRNNEICRAVVNRFADYVVGLGAMPQAQTKDKAWNSEAEAWWKEVYVPTVDYRQRQGVDDVSNQEMVVRSRLFDGDCGFVRLSNGQLQPVESERIGTPTGVKPTNQTQITGGVKTQKKGGLVLGYFISPRNANGLVDKSKYSFVRRDNFIHCYKPVRMDQLRGIPELAPVLAKLKDYDETDTNVFAKIKNDSMNLYNRESGSGGSLANEIARRSSTKTNSDSKDKQKVEKQEWGQIWKDGKLTAIESKTPNGQYVQYLEHELKAISAALDLPYEFVMLIFTKGSYSAQRSAMLSAMHTFKKWHNWMTKVYCQPNWNWRIAKAIKNGQLPPAPTRTLPNGLEVSQWFKVEWTMPYYEWIDPEKQAKADEKRFNMGSTSMRRIIKSQGADPEEISNEKTADIDLAIKQAAKLNADNPGAGIVWQDMISTAVPGAKTAAEAEPVEPKEVDDEEEEGEGDEPEEDK